MAAIPKFVERRPDLQFLHLTGLKDIERCAGFWRECGARGVVTPFLSEMDMGLSAANVAVSRSGASSLAEFAAMRLPAILVPYPTAADNHQVYNARAFVAVRRRGDDSARRICGAEALVADRAGVA